MGLLLLADELELEAEDIFALEDDLRLVVIVAFFVLANAIAATDVGVERCCSLIGDRKRDENDEWDEARRKTVATVLSIISHVARE